MMRGSYLKRRYTDLRTGGVTLNPIIQASNFMMLAYITISESIPMIIFAPIFLISIFVLFTGVGLTFRKVQLSTDLDIIYERNQSLNATLYQIMLGIDDGNKGKKFYDRMDYVKKLSEGTV